MTSSSEFANDYLDYASQHSRFIPDTAPAFDADLMAEVESLLSGLTPKQREAVELRGYGSLTHKEAASLMGISKDAAYIRWLRAKERLTGETADMLSRVREMHNMRARWARIPVSVRNRLITARVVALRDMGLTFTEVGRIVWPSLSEGHSYDRAQSRYRRHQQIRRSGAS